MLLVVARPNPVHARNLEETYPENLKWFPLFWLREDCQPSLTPAEVQQKESWLPLLEDYPQWREPSLPAHLTPA